MIEDLLKRKLIQYRDIDRFGTKIDLSDSNFSNAESVIRVWGKATVMVTGELEEKSSYSVWQDKMFSQIELQGVHA